jgi:hypothetical protein
MKRSEINIEIERAKTILEEIKFKLPPFAYWPPEAWKKNDVDNFRIKQNGLGWDITDFGSGEFEKIGAIIFTLRNGNYQNKNLGTPYAEKIIVLKPEQEIPLHFHWEKTEDIINRGGGVFMVQLYNSKSDHTVDYESDLSVYCDGVKKDVGAGGILELEPGESITLTPEVYHRFWAKPGHGYLVCGEVSSINDDTTDNYFAVERKRYADILEDEKPIHLLCNEY